MLIGPTTKLPPWFDAVAQRATVELFQRTPKGIKVELSFPSKVNVTLLVPPDVGTFPHLIEALDALVAILREHGPKPKQPDLPGVH